MSFKPLEESLVYEDPQGRFIVAEVQLGRYYMYRTIHCNWITDRIAELTNKESLEKSYKGSFEIWYNKIRAKKEKTIDSYLRQKDELDEKILELQRNWNL